MYPPPSPPISLYYITYLERKKMNTNIPEIERCGPCDNDGRCLNDITCKEYDAEDTDWSHCHNYFIKYIKKDSVKAKEKALIEIWDMEKKIWRLHRH